MRLTRLFEGLDDKDEFENCTVCPNNEGYLVPPQYQPEEFHFDHIDAHNAGNKARDAATHDDSYDAWIEASRKVMVSRGYKRITSIHGQDYWFKIPIKEDLDDQDQFGPECGYCMQYASEVGDQQRFHEKHEQAEIMAERASWEVQGGWNSSAGRQKYSDIFNIEMWRFGYVRQDSRGPWIDKPLKEDLDDQDEFLVPNVRHYQLEDSTEDNEHWLIDMRNEADDQRLQGEYWVRGGMGKGMYLKANFSQLDDNTAHRILTDASGVGVGDYHVDWDQAVADAQRTGY